MVHYRPILKAKPGELQALGTLAASTASSVTPILEICPADTPQEAVTKALKPAKTYLSGYGVVGIDAGQLPNSVGGVILPTRIATELATLGIEVIPVVRLGDSADRLSSAAAIAAGHGRGAVLRLEFDLPALGHGLNAASVSTVLTALSLTPASVDLLIDFGPITGVAPSLVDAARDLVNAASSLGAWRSVTVGAGAFPSSISSFATGVRHAIPRVDAELWRELIGRGFAVDFSDYAINHPALGAGGRGPLPNLRYTDGRTWAIWREQKNRPGNESFFDLCKKVVADPAWAGVPFSWGDSEIDKKAREATPRAGSATQWRAYGTSHHITTVVDRLATLGEP